MKIKYDDDKIIVYVYEYKFNFDNMDILNKEIKNLFIKLIKSYKVMLKGYLNVKIYVNKKYGYILEIEKIDSFIELDIVDLKVSIIDDVPFYLKTDNYLIISNCNNIYYDNDYFYVDILEIDNLYLLEYGDIIYNQFIKENKNIL